MYRIQRFISIQEPRNIRKKTKKSEVLTRPGIRQNRGPTRGSIRPVDNSAANRTDPVEKREGVYYNHRLTPVLTTIHGSQLTACLDGSR